MPIRGETIGAAYVKVLADGDDLPKSVREAFAGSEDEFSAQGRRSSAAYVAEWEKTLSKGPSVDRLRKALDKAIFRSDLANNYFAGPKWAQFVRRMQKEFGEAGTLAAKELEDKFLSQGDLRGLQGEINQIFSRVARSTREIRAEQLKSLKADEKAMHDFEVEFRRVVDETDALSRQVSKDTDTMLSSIRSRLERLRLDFGRGRLAVTKALADDVQRTSAVIQKDRHYLITFGRDIDRIGLGVSRVFGRGSRSELLNFFGVMTGNMFKIIALAPKVLGFMFEWSRAFLDIYKNASASQGAVRAFVAAAGGATTALGGMSAGFGEIAATGPVGLLLIAAAAVVAFLAIGPLAALIAGLTGIILAFAASVVYALGAAILPLVGILPVLALSIGGVVALMVSFAGHTERLQKIVKPLSDELSGLGKAIREIALDALNDNMDELLAILQSVEPLITAVAKGVVDSIAAFADAADSPGFRKFADIMERRIPRMFAKLTEIGIQFAAGAGGWFETLTVRGGPVDQFLDMLDRATERFDEFVNGTVLKSSGSRKMGGPLEDTFATPGRQSILDFFDRAKDSLSEIWDLLKNVGDIFITLAEAGGQESGNSMLESLNIELEKFGDWLDEHKEDIRQFFLDAESVAGALGRVAVAIGQVIAAFDTPLTRSVLAAALETIIFWLDRLAAAADGAQWALEQLGALVSGGIGGIGDAFGSIGESLQGAWEGIQNNPIFSGGSSGRMQLISGFSTLGPQLAGAASSVVNQLGAALQPFLGTVRTWAGNVRSRFAEIPGSIRALIDRFVSAVEAIVDAMLPDDLSDLRDALDDIVDEFAKLPGRILGAVAGLGARVLAEITPGGGRLHSSVNLNGVFSEITGGAGRREVAPSGRVVAEFNIVTPTEDPRAVAAEILAQWTGSGNYVTV